MKCFVRRHSKAGLPLWESFVGAQPMHPNLLTSMRPEDTLRIPGACWPENRDPVPHRPLDRRHGSHWYSVWWFSRSMTLAGPPIVVWLSEWESASGLPEPSFDGGQEACSWERMREQATAWMAPLESCQRMAALLPALQVVAQALEVSRRLPRPRQCLWARLVRQPKLSLPQRWSWGLLHPATRLLRAELTA